MGAWPAPLLWSLTTACLTGESSESGVSLRWLSMEMGKAIAGLHHPGVLRKGRVMWQGGRQEGKKMLKKAWGWKRAEHSKYKSLLLPEKKKGGKIEPCHSAY